jgi:hypothetical protein
MNIFGPTSLKVVTGLLEARSDIEGHTADRGLYACIMSSEEKEDRRSSHC